MGTHNILPVTDLDLFLYLNRIGKLGSNDPILSYMLMILVGHFVELVEKYILPDISKLESSKSELY